MQMFDWTTIFGGLMSIILTIALSIGIGVLLLFIIWKSVVAMAMKPASGAKRLIGIKGIATTNIAPHGTVLADGTRWQAKTDGENIRKGEPVEIVAVEKLHITVKKITA